jgi:hypothetical protein
MPYKSKADQVAWHKTHCKERAAYWAKYYVAHRTKCLWKAMHQRCKDFAVYRDFVTYKDVRVCARWSGPKGFIHFLADMGEPPVGTSLSRLADTGNYYKRNCRWHTPAQQRAEARKKRESQ